MNSFTIFHVEGPWGNPLTKRARSHTSAVFAAFENHSGIRRYPKSRFRSIRQNHWSVVGLVFRDCSNHLYHCFQRVKGIMIANRQLSSHFSTCRLLKHTQITNQMTVKSRIAMATPNPNFMWNSRLWWNVALCVLENGRTLWLLYNMLSDLSPLDKLLVNNVLKPAMDPITSHLIKRQSIYNMFNIWKLL